LLEILNRKTRKNRRENLGKMLNLEELKGLKRLEKDSLLK
jgi:hypothetical protein